MTALTPTGKVIKPEPFRADTYAIGPAPEGMAWQWVNKDELVGFIERGWSPVERERVPGDCDHCEWDGKLIVLLNGSILVEKEIEGYWSARKKDIDKAHQNVQDWVDKHGGAVRIISEDSTGAKSVQEFNAEELDRTKELFRGKENQVEGSGSHGEGASGSDGEPPASEGGS